MVIEGRSTEPITNPYVIVDNRTLLHITADIPPNHQQTPPSLQSSSLTARSLFTTSYLENKFELAWNIHDTAHEWNLKVLLEVSGQPC